MCISYAVVLHYRVDGISKHHMHACHMYETQLVLNLIAHRNGGEVQPPCKEY